MVINDINADNVRVTANEVRNCGVEALEAVADVSDFRAVEGMVRETVEKFSRLDILVNNAGIISTALIEVDPLTCPKCSGKMKVISVIEDENVIKKILKHLGLWDQKARPPPKANSPPMAPQYHIDYTDSQLPVSDNYLYVDPQYPETFTT